MKELSRFKVLSITLLMTMSSCVAGAVEVNAETLRTYGIEFDAARAEKIQSVQRYRKSKTSADNKFRFTRLVESGRKHFSFRGLTLDYSPVTVHLSLDCFIEPLLNDKVRDFHEIYQQSYKGISFLNRAGPASLLS